MSLDFNLKPTVEIDLGTLKADLVSCELLGLLVQCQKYPYKPQIRKSWLANELGRNRIVKLAAMDHTRSLSEKGSDPLEVRRGSDPFSDRL